MKKVFLSAFICGTALFASCGGNTPTAEFKNEIDTISYELGIASSASKAEFVKYLTSPQVGCDSAFVEEFLKGFKDGFFAGEDKKKQAYIAGMSMGSNMRKGVMMTEKQVFAEDSTKHLNADNVMAGFFDHYNGKDSLFKVNGQVMSRQAIMQEVNSRLQKLADKNLEAKYVKEVKASKDFMAKKAKEEGIKSLPGGTLYKVVKEGTGATPKDGQKVTMTYVGKLTDGTIFDQTAEGKPAVMMVGQTVPGFTEALKAMKVGSTWEVYIPYDQGYGSQDLGTIKPFSVLVFTITLEGVEDVKAAAAPVAVAPAAQQ